MLDGVRYITDREVPEILELCGHSLQQRRNKGLALFDSDGARCRIRSRTCGNVLKGTANLPDGRQNSGTLVFIYHL